MTTTVTLETAFDQINSQFETLITPLITNGDIKEIILGSKNKGTPRLPIHHNSTRPLDHRHHEHGRDRPT